MITRYNKEHFKLLKKALFIRFFEEKILHLYNTNQLYGTTHTCIGQEIIPVCLSQFINKKDTITSNHRNHGHFLALYPNKAPDLVAELYGHENGINSGNSGSQHISFDRFFASGLQGGLLPFSLGAAYSNKLRKKNEIVVCYIGDGTFGEGVLYECMNIASQLSLPIIYIVEDNKYSQSTHQSENLSGSICDRSHAFGIKYYRSHSFDLSGLINSGKRAFSYVRKYCKPVVLHVHTYRLSPHSKGEDFRNNNEVNEFKKKDLLSKLIADNKNKEIIQLTIKSVEKAFKTSILLNKNKNKMLNYKKKLPSNKVTKINLYRPQNEFIGNQINLSLKSYFKNNKNAVLIGEDVRDPYGGAFKITKGLSTQFNERIINMPISESAIVGMGFGMAFTGTTAFVEIMFGDFISLAFDQLLNQISKYNALYSEKKIPLIIRTPMGGGRGYGYTHSQCLEKFLYGIPNTRILLLNCWVNIDKFFKNTIYEIEKPCLLIEYKNLYSVASIEIPDQYVIESNDINQSMISIKTKKTADLTVIVFGGISLEVHKIIAKLSVEEIYLDIYAPVDLHNCSIDEIIKSIALTKKIIFIEEGTGTSSISTDFFRKILTNWPNAEMIKSKFVHATDFPIPVASKFEKQVLPTGDYIFQKCIELYHE